MALKLVISDPKTGKTKQIDSESALGSLSGRRVGQSVSGKELSMDEGYEFAITGGSDNAGFPMRREIAATGRHTIMAVEGVGLKKTRHGVRRRKTVAGGIISNQTAQVNLKITKQGKTSLFEDAAPEQTA